MSNQDAIQDENKVYALIAHSGTADTAETRRVVTDTSGNLMVNIAAGETINVGTLTLGTIDILKLGTVAVVPLGGAVLSSSVAVGSTATAIPTTPLTSRKSLILYNSGTSRISLGGIGVTTTTGLPLGTADYSPSIDLGTTVLYGIADTAGGTVIAMEAS